MPEPTASSRAHLRVPILVTQVKMGDDRRYFFGYAKNVSRSGIFIQTISPKDVGEEFSVEFIIPKADLTIKCKCKVIWNRRFSEAGKYEPGMGLKFEDIDPDLLARLDDWITKHAAEAERTGDY